MRNGLFKSITMLFMALTVVLTGSFSHISAGEIEQIKEPIFEELAIEEVEVPKVEMAEDSSEEIDIFVEESEPEIEEELPLSREEIELIALVTMAEAEAEPEEGQRLVIDTILNRVDSGYFPDTVYDVVYQKNQFTSMWNGRTSRCYIREDLVQLVEEELRNRKNSEVVFFRTGRYSDYGEPLFLVGHHYFSRY